ncbi:MAG: hypothetical protein LBN43_09335, partial [Oscillospiraceae bacterium]|nr:hypothetical protein [Oscillospiraceae bacterium]
MKATRVDELTGKALETYTYYHGKYTSDYTFYEPQLSRMRHNEDTYSGNYSIIVLPEFDLDAKQLKHFAGIRVSRGNHGIKDLRAKKLRWLVCNELTEATIDSSIPRVKVQAKDPKMQELATLVEDLVTNIVDRIPCEEDIDISERVVPTDGGGYYDINWIADEDIEQKGIDITFQHPTKVIPQQGIYSGIDDMDRYFIVIPSTKEAIERQYGVEVNTARAGDYATKVNDEKAIPVLQENVDIKICFYRNDDGNIGKLAWCGDTVLEWYDDYYARHMEVCSECGAPWTLAEDNLNKKGDPICPVCGSKKHKESTLEYEELTEDITLLDGTVIPAFKELPPVTITIPGLQPGTEQTIEVKPPSTEPTQIPYYKPKSLPLVLQRNISRSGQLLGDSDCEKIEEIQDDINVLLDKVYDKIVSSGTLIAFAPDAHLDDNILNSIKTYYTERPVSDELVSQRNIQFPIDQEFQYIQYLHEVAKLVLGVTGTWMGQAEGSN